MLLGTCCGSLGVVEVLDRVRYARGRFDPLAGTGLAGLATTSAPGVEGVYWREGSRCDLK